MKTGPNEDFAAVAPDVAVLLDGARLPQGVSTAGCTHGVAWYSRSLGTALLAEILARPPGTLRSALAGAITALHAWLTASACAPGPAFWR